VNKPNAPPRGTNAKTERPALGLADRFLNSSACCGKGCWSLYCCHAREDACDEDLGSCLVIASNYLCSVYNSIDSTGAGR
jgi:hypothetical protein